MGFPVECCAIKRRPCDPGSAVLVVDKGTDRSWQEAQVAKEQSSSGSVIMQIKTHF